MTLDEKQNSYSYRHDKKQNEYNRNAKWVEDFEQNDKKANLVQKRILSLSLSHTHSQGSVQVQDGGWSPVSALLSQNYLQPDWSGGGVEGVWSRNGGAHSPMSICCSFRTL